MKKKRNYDFGGGRFIFHLKVSPKRGERFESR